VAVSGLSGVTAAGGGYWHSLALKADGTVWAWGSNEHGQLGNGAIDPAADYPTPAQVTGPGGVGFLTGVTAIAVGTHHNLALKGDGTVWAWGRNANGQLGDNTTASRPAPVQVKGPGGVGVLTGVTAIGAGSDHSLAAKGDGTAWAWGKNANGQLGDDTTTQRRTPVQVSGLTGATKLGGGDFHSLGLAPAAATRTTAYGYDRLYRLTSATATGGDSTSYAYDPVGNRMTRTRNGTPTSYAYDRADRITGAGGVSYTVNAAGNLTARGGDAFGYDQANRLTSATVGGVSSQDAYDGDGKRASQTVGAATTRYVYDVNAGLPMLLDDGARKYVWGLGLAYATDMGGAVQAVHHTDGLGSARALTNSAGAVTDTYQTDEFGMPTVTTGGSVQPFGYTGEQLDGETGLVYLRARMYDPAIGRFVQRDPYAGRIGSPQSLHRYTYVQNNPVSATDPSGLTPYLCQRPPQTALEWLSFRECVQQERERIRQGGGGSGECQGGSGNLVIGPIGVLNVPSAPCTMQGTHSASDREREEELEDLIYTDGIDVLHPHGMAALLEHGWTATMVRAAIAAGIQAVQREDGRFIYWIRQGGTFKTLVMEGQRIITAVDRTAQSIDFQKVTGRWIQP
jgi:RHS repeat-associated protein